MISKEYSNQELLLIFLRFSNQINDQQFTDQLKKITENNTALKTYVENHKSDSLVEQFKSYLKEFSLEVSSIKELPIFKVKRLYMDGCFDLMHSGHFNAIRQSKAMAETLVVGVISDEAILLNKGPYIMNYEERVAIVKACKWVDEIIKQEDYDPSIELLDKVNCSHCAHGDDTPINAQGNDGYSVMVKANRILRFKRTEGISTTDIVGRLLFMTKDHLQCNEQANHNESLRKLSQEQVEGNIPLSSSQLKESIEKYQPNLPNVKLLNTSRRINLFASGNKAPSLNDKVIYVDGAFDIIHHGHIDFLRRAKEMGTFLLVGLFDDSTINQVKGSNYPVLNIQERVLNLLSIKYVDEVIIGAPLYITEQMIKHFNISNVVEGTISSIHNTIGSDPYNVPKKMGIHKLLESINFSMDDLIKRILENRKKFIEIQKKKEKKLQSYYENQQQIVEI